MWGRVGGRKGVGVMGGWCREGVGVLGGVLGQRCEVQRSEVNIRVTGRLTEG